MMRSLYLGTDLAQQQKKLIGLIKLFFCFFFLQSQNTPKNKKKYFLKTQN